MELTQEYKQKVIDAIKIAFENYGGNQTDFSRVLGIHHTVLSQLLQGKQTNAKGGNLLDRGVWIRIGRKLNVDLKESKWKFVRTSVYNEIEDNIKFCKEHHKGMILVDDCGIGKTVAGKRVASQLKNAFYIDCSQYKSKRRLVKAFANTVGIDANGRLDDVNDDVKYFITNIEKPVFILDEVGDLELSALLELKAYMNATVGACGWYFMGAQGLKAKMQRGIDNNKIGFAEIFDRLSDRFVALTPHGKEDRVLFYTDLIGTVASAQVDDPALVRKLVNQCLKEKSSLRKLETLIDLI